MRTNPTGVALQSWNPAQHALARSSVLVAVSAVRGELSNVEEAPGNRNVARAIPIKPEVLGDATGKGAHTREMSGERRIDGSYHLMHRIDQVLGRRSSDGNLFPCGFFDALPQRVQS